MVEVNGESPSRQAARVLTIRKSGEEVSIWIHPPGSPEDSGWEIVVPMNELRDALAAERVSS